MIFVGWVRLGVVEGPQREDVAAPAGLAAVGSRHAAGGAVAARVVDKQARVQLDARVGAGQQRDGRQIRQHRKGARTVLVPRYEAAAAAALRVLRRRDAAPSAKCQARVLTRDLLVQVKRRHRRAIIDVHNDLVVYRCAGALLRVRVCAVCRRRINVRSSVQQRHVARLAARRRVGRLVVDGHARGRGPHGAKGVQCRVVRVARVAAPQHRVLRPRLVPVLDRVRVGGRADIVCVRAAV